MLTALRYFASGSFLKVVGDTMGVSKASASRSVHDVAECLCHLAKEWITFPTAPEEINVSLNICFISLISSQRNEKTV